ncbi:hypothetical protein CO670_17375 [Rhizobium sp. J15]|uniref:hypothetical protein n=1 Tax=Rhizobium sp. J15 TaxID=2035450 RepID=UPI000BE858AF|nr:hypothetical protein [Rhizobium sp. J15]PDT15543.1 hypothetical protein CO670_17375 [Rhizobium sp. J15]
MDRKAIDLTLVRKALAKHNDLKELVDAIRKYEAASSVLAELSDVIVALDAIAEIQTNAMARSKFSGSLMVDAVVTYCRATHSKGAARGHIGATKRYTTAQMEKHRRIVDLRDKVFAHQGFPSEEHGLRWLDERAVVKLVGGDGILSFNRTRANYLAAAVEDLRELVAIAAATAKSLSEERGMSVHEVHLKHADDPRVMEAIRASPFDPYDFFGPGQDADEFWDIAHGKRGEILRNSDR